MKIQVWELYISLISIIFQNWLIYRIMIIISERWQNRGWRGTNTCDSLKISMTALIGGLLDLLKKTKKLYLSALKMVGLRLVCSVSNNNNNNNNNKLY